MLTYLPPHLDKTEILSEFSASILSGGHGGMS